MNENETNSIIEKVKELVKKGDVARIVVRHGKRELLNISVNTGIIGVAAALLTAKWLLLAGVLATVGFGCTVVVIKDDGEEIDVLKDGDAQKVKETAANVVKDVKDAVVGKAEEVIDEFEEVVSKDEKPAEPEEDHAEVKPEEEGPANE